MALATVASASRMTGVAWIAATRIVRRIIDATLPRRHGRTTEAVRTAGPCRDPSRGELEQPSDRRRACATNGVRSCARVVTCCKCWSSRCSRRRAPAYAATPVSDQYQSAPPPVVKAAPHGRRRHGAPRRSAGASAKPAPASGTAPAARRSSRSSPGKPPVAAPSRPAPPPGRRRGRPAGPARGSRVRHCRSACSPSSACSSSRSASRPSAGRAGPRPAPDRRAPRTAPGGAIGRAVAFATRHSGPPIRACWR